jgi:N-methylhydantoinase B
MYDFSCGVFDADGETVAQDELIPAFLGTMAATMPFVLEAVESEGISEGDAYFTNDPYRGGTHTPDIQLFVPILRDGRLVAWCGNIAHHSDVGGTNPGTEGYANSSIFEEGVRIPPVRVVEDGALNEPLLRILENNIRDPRSTAGDFRAQLAAARLGQRRVGELLDRYGVETVCDAMAALLDQSERRIRASIAARADGVAESVGWLDDDGIGSDPVKIAVAIEVAGDRVTVDLTGSAEQVAGGMNMSETAAKAAIYFAVKAIFDPDAPHNGAIVRPIEMTLPEGSIANPRFPAAVSPGTWRCSASPTR